jgi:hypothetical protein
MTISCRAKPHILVKLQSQSPYLLLKDTSLITVQVMYPDGSLHNYFFSGDTVRFTPATNANNNVATVDFTPAFSTQVNPQGDIYQLIVTGKDELGTMAGTGPYRVGFTVINKPMISNVFNYPNPFSTSTAFVFTITGTQVPQNMKIQILTITGRWYGRSQRRNWDRCMWGRTSRSSSGTVRICMATGCEWRIFVSCGDEPERTVAEQVQCSGRQYRQVLQ